MGRGVVTTVLTEVLTWTSDQYWDSTPDRAEAQQVAERLDSAAECWVSHMWRPLPVVSVVDMTAGPGQVASHCVGAAGPHSGSSLSVLSESLGLLPLLTQGLQTPNKAPAFLRPS